MARQSGVTTPIFDELLREMTEGVPPTPPTTGTPGNPTQDPTPRRRHRAD